MHIGMPFMIKCYVSQHTILCKLVDVYLPQSPNHQGDQASKRDDLKPPSYKKLSMLRSFPLLKLILIPLKKVVNVQRDVKNLSCCQAHSRPAVWEL